MDTTRNATRNLRPFKRTGSSTRWRNAIQVSRNDRLTLEAKLFPGLALILLAASAVADTALHDAVDGRDAERVRQLLAAGADVNATDDSGYTPLHTAVSSGNKREAMASLLIEAGANVNATADNGFTPLHSVLLIWAGRITWAERLARLLIEAGADPNARDDEGNTPLLYTRWRGADAMQLLINAGADVNAKMPITRRGTAQISDGTLLHNLMLVPHNQAAEEVRLLIEASADLDATDGYGKTPLHHAAGFVWSGHAQSLLEAGAKVDARDSEGHTPLHRLAQASSSNQIEQSPKVAAMLLAYGADPNATGNSGRTPLHYAVENDNIEVTRELLFADADLTASGTDGLTPLHLAAHNGHEAMARFLIEAGADLAASDADGLTPADKAAQKGHYQLARLLRE